ncbi:MAG: hypothetical protein H0T89_17960 [Deltaproteobacteria bacterium]|nr:hypothetical protein [Deltaproteobacteria bacterium]MDQ3298140.1 hypothetical protein [Myxococcota bacterium]
MDSFFLLQTIGPMLGVASMVLAALVVAPVILYVVARWRAHREVTPDSQLGIKFALHYFAISAFQLALAGAALLLYLLISPGSDKGAGYRAAFGFLLPAGLVLALHLGLLNRTNDAYVPGVRRLFLGYNLLVTGLVGFVALVIGFQALFAKGSSRGVGHMAGSMIIVYGSAWIAIGWKLGQLVLGGGGFGSMGAPPLATMTANTPPAPSAVGLPALGGGAYPPIDPTQQGPT